MFVLTPIEEQLLQKVFSIREQALPVDNLNARLLNAAQFLCQRRGSSDVYNVVIHSEAWLYIILLVIHNLQRDPKESVGEAINFINNHCTLLDEPLEEFICTSKYFFTIIEIYSPHKAIFRGGSSTWITCLCIFQCIQRKQF